MPSNFDATRDIQRSISHIETLIQYAIVERDNGNEENRMLFLKLAVVSTVTKFQVFIESILKEYVFVLKSANKKYNQVSHFLRLNSIRIFTSDSDKIIHKVLENYETYSPQKLQEVKDITTKTLAFCDDNESLNEDLQFETKFPLGKTGVKELIKLFRQVNGENIFENPPFDVNKLNEILARRHAIIHEDSNPQITEDGVGKYRDYIIIVVDYIDNYLAQNL